MKNRLICARTAAPVLSLLSLAVGASLHAQALELNPVVVTASRVPQPLSDVLPSVSVITRAEIEKSQAPSLADLLQGETGFEFGRNGGPGAVTSLFLRGQNSNGVVLLVDGVRAQTDGGGNLTVTDFPLALIERIEILRGNAGALYGEAAVGGVIHIHTRQFKGGPAPFGSVTVGSRGLLDVNAGFGGNTDGYAYNLVAGKATADGFSAMNATMNPAVNADKDGHTQSFVSAKLDKAVSADVSVGLRLRSGQSKVDYDNEWNALPSDVNRSHKNARSVGAHLRAAVTPQWTSTLDVSRSQTDAQELTNGAQSSRFASTKNAIHWRNAYQLTAQTSADLGLDLARDHHAQHGSFELTRKTTAAYAGLTHRMDALTLQANLRNDKIDIQRQVGAAASTSQPRVNSGLVGLGYQLSPQWRLTSSVSTGFRAPEAYDISTNPLIGSEKYLSREAGLVFSNAQVWARMVYFSTDTENAIGYDSAYKAVNTGHIRNNGFESSVRANLWGNSVKLSYVQQKPWSVTLNEPLARRARSHGALDVSRDVGGFEVGTKIHSTAARPDMDYQLYRPVSLTGYATAALYASRKLDNQWTARVRLDNVLNKQHQLAYGYNTPGRSAVATLQYSPK